MKVIILAGGKGTRLWPLSNEAIPKQFLSFGEKKSLLQKTILRFLKHVPAQNLFIATHKNYKEILETQISEIDPLLLSNLIIEREGRNTAPAILLSIAYLRERSNFDPNEPLLFSPSDHIYEEEGISNITPSASHITLFGMKPYKIETGYGYIKAYPNPASSLYDVETFIEKPAFEKAKSFLSAGNYYWNMGLFLFTPSLFSSLVIESAPQLAPFLEMNFATLLQNYALLPSQSIDHALIEKTTKLKMALMKGTWSDIGSWDSIYELLEKDGNENAKVGKVIDINVKNSLIIGGKRLISLIDIEDLILIETDDVLLLAKKGSSQKVKELEKLIQNQNNPDDLR